MKYWQAILKNGKYADETENNWGDVQGQIKRMELNNDGQIISLPEGMDEYIQAKTASASLTGSDVQIESRYIAFKKGNTLVRIRIDEKTGNINVEVD